MSEHEELAEEEDEPVWWEKEPDPELAAQLEQLDEGVLWWEIGRRTTARTQAELEAKPDPEWHGRWDVPLAPEGEPRDPATLAEPAEPVTRRQLHAALDAMQVSSILAGVGLPECRSSNIGGGAVVVASDAALVFYWGQGFGRRHALTAATTMLEAYQHVLERHGVYVQQVWSKTLPELHLRCAVPRRGLNLGDLQLQVEAAFSPAAEPSAERDARDRRLAIEAVDRILAELQDRDPLFAFLEPSHQLHQRPWLAQGVRPISPRTVLLLRGLLELHRTGTAPEQVAASDWP